MDMSTISPEVSREVARTLAEKGLHMLDAPISGSPVTVKQGTASIIVAGNKSAFEKAQKILKSIGPKVSHIGENGLVVHVGGVNKYRIILSNTLSIRL